MDEFFLEGAGTRGRDKPGGDSMLGRNDLDGEGDVVVAVQDLGDDGEDVLHAPFIGEVEDVIPVHAGAVFAQEEDEVDVAVVVGI